MASYSSAVINPRSRSEASRSRVAVGSSVGAAAGPPVAAAAAPAVAGSTAAAGASAGGAADGLVQDGHLVAPGARRHRLGGHEVRRRLPLVRLRGDVRSLDHFLLVHHRDLELDRVGDHREVLDAAQLVGGGQDVQVAEPEQAAEHALGQHCVVHLLEAGLDHPLVQDPLGPDDPAGGHQELVVPPVPDDPADAGEGKNQQAEGHDLRRAVRALVRRAGHEDQDRQRQDGEDDGPPGSPHDDEPVLAALEHDFLASGQQLARVTHRSPQARGCARAYTSRTRSPVRWV